MSDCNVERLEHKYDRDKSSLSDGVCDQSGEMKMLNIRLMRKASNCFI